MTIAKQVFAAFLGCVLCAHGVGAHAQQPASVRAAASPTRRAPILDHANMPVVRTTRVNAEIRLDGRLDEPAWQSVPVATGFTQVDPDDGEPDSQRTEVRMLYDDDAIYVGAVMHDTGYITSRLARRDVGILDTDYFAVIFDSYHDHVQGFRIRTTPSDARRDELMLASRIQPQGGTGGGDATWDIVWEAKSAVTDSGWVAEFRIPFSQLRFSNDSIQRWGVQFERRINRRQERSLYAYTPKSMRAGPGRYAHLEGLSGLGRGRSVELLPYVLTRGDYRSVPTNPALSIANPFRDGSDYGLSAGADVKLRVTSNMTLSATANPDFGQVEVDPAVINLTAFETRYDEKRPFFVEAAQIFEFGGSDGAELLYSRRVGRAPTGAVPSIAAYAGTPDAAAILGAAKLTGRTQKGWSVGLIDAVTSREIAPYVMLSGERREVEVEPLTNYFVGRLSRAFRAGQSSVGAMATAVNRDFRDDPLSDRMAVHAYVGGADFLHEWANRTWSVLGSLSGSSIGGRPGAIAFAQRVSSRYFQRPDADHITLDPLATSLRGYALRLDAGRRAGFVQGGAMVSALSPGYEINDLGFQGTVDRLAVDTYVRLEQNDPGRVLRLWSLNAGPDLAWNYGGDALRRSFSIEADASFRNFWTSSIDLGYLHDAYDDRLTRGGPITRTAAARSAGFSVRSDNRNRFIVNVSASRTWDEAGGGLTSLGLNLTARPVSPLEVIVGPKLEQPRIMAQYVSTETDPLAANTFGRRYVFAELTQKTLSLDTRVNVTFTPELTLELYAQPYISSGNYENLKELRSPGTFVFNRYGVDAGTSTRDNTGNYTIDPDGSGPAKSFRTADRDFNFQSMRGNAVVRWEWRRGSALYFVWQQNRARTLAATTAGYTMDPAVGTFDASRDARDLFGLRPDNVFLVKLNYWFNL